MTRKYSFHAAVFDLDGVVTKTAVVHSAAWKKTFDEYLRLIEKRDGKAFSEFTAQDYRDFVDGKPRYDGVKSFLESRGIDIPLGDPADAAGTETVCGVGNRKNDMFRKVLEEDGVEIYQSTVDLIRALKADGVRVGVASSSKNCRYILESADLGDLFETRVDGEVSAEIGLQGKPEGDIFVKAAENLDCRPEYSIVFEDALSGVMAGRNGGFGLVIGIAREDNRDALLENGADIAVNDLSELPADMMEKWFAVKPAPLFDVWEDTAAHKARFAAVSGAGPKINPDYLRTGRDVFCGPKKPVFFLDYDGTLTPIVSRPDLAVLTDEMRETIRALSRKFTTAIVSGRMREDVENLLGIEGLFYAGSHGFDIRGPGLDLIQPKARETIPLVAEVIEECKKELAGIEGLLVEEKKFSMAVHYRLVDEKHLPAIEKLVTEITARNKDNLRLMHGKKVFEILPAMDWNKGKAVRWIMKAMKLDWNDVTTVYMGDDTTDGFAFRAVRSRGYGVMVSENPEGCPADFGLKTPKDVAKLFKTLTS